MLPRWVVLVGSVVVLATGVRPYSDDICPNEEFIKPCTCKVTGLGLYVVCTEVRFFSTLQKAFKTLADYSMGRVLIHRLMAAGEELPKDLFIGMRVVALRFTDCDFDITADGQPVFAGLEDSLVRLEFRNNHVGGDGLVKNSLSHLTNLRDLMVSDSMVGRVPRTWLADGPGGLDMLELDKNQIESVDSRAFSGLHELVSVSLKKNELRHVARSVLPDPAHKLREIDLSFNQLTELPADFFEHFGALRVVNLQGNQIATLSGAVWEPVWNSLEEVYLQGNPLHCDKDLRWALQQALPPTTEGMCSTPEHLKGMDLVNVKLQDISTSTNRLVRLSRKRRRRIQK